MASADQPSGLVIAVAGTNGKGSCVAMLDAVLRDAGLKTGSYTSPHLVRYNERVRINGRAADDAALCAAFVEIERARDGIPLTYFEFGTLCALMIFRRQGVEVSILEVGMGGRLDAVNLIANDIALITSIGIDHARWLGADRTAIAVEKAGDIERKCPGGMHRSRTAARHRPHRRRAQLHAAASRRRLRGRTSRRGHSLAQRPPLG